MKPIARFSWDQEEFEVGDRLIKGISWAIDIDNRFEHEGIELLRRQLKGYTIYLFRKKRCYKVTIFNIWNKFEEGDKLVVLAPASIHCHDAPLKEIYDEETYPILSC